MRTWTATLAATALAISLSACSSDDPDEAADDPTTASSGSSSSEPAASPSESQASAAPSEDLGTTVKVVIKGDKVSPSGKRVKIERDVPVLLLIESDRAGELHVHSKPEQYVEFEAGLSKNELVVSAPGIVDVEDHDTGTVIVQLEVS